MFPFFPPSILPVLSFSILLSHSFLSFFRPLILIFLSPLFPHHSLSFFPSFLAPVLLLLSFPTQSFPSFFLPPASLISRFTLLQSSFLFQCVLRVFPLIFFPFVPVVIGYERCQSVVNSKNKQFICAIRTFPIFDVIWDAVHKKK